MPKNISFFFPQTIFPSSICPITSPIFQNIAKLFFSISYKLKFFLFDLQFKMMLKFAWSQSKFSILYHGDMFSLCFHSAWIILKYSSVLPTPPLCSTPQGQARTTFEVHKEDTHWICCLSSHATFVHGLLRWQSGKESACQCRRHTKRGFDPWGGKILWRKKQQLTPAFLPGTLTGQRSLVGYNPCGHKELDMTENTHIHFCW